MVLTDDARHIDCDRLDLAIHYGINEACSVVVRQLIQDFNGDERDGRRNIGRELQQMESVLRYILDLSDNAQYGYEALERVK